MEATTRLLPPYQNICRWSSWTLATPATYIPVQREEGGVKLPHKRWSKICLITRLGCEDKCKWVVITSTRVGVKGCCHTSCVVCKENSPHACVWTKQLMPTTHACMWVFFLDFPVFKMSYLVYEKSDWTSVFTIKSIATRSSKLDLISIYVDEFFRATVAMILHCSCHGVYPEVAVICLSYFFFYI